MRQMKSHDSHNIADRATAQIALVRHLEQLRRAGMSADDILEALKIEITEFEVLENERVQEPVDGRLDSVNGRIVSEAADEMTSMNVAARGAKGGLAGIQDNCARLQNGSIGAAESAGAMRSSVSEIFHQAKSASDTVAQIVASFGLAQDNGARLEIAVEKVSSVVDLIRTIARQTNLLALNATIEAARVGDSGRGFAVVAAEVKALANQTSGATEEIASQVSQIESTSRETIKLVRSANADIQGMSERLRLIVGSVSLQENAVAEVIPALEACGSALGRLRDAMARVAGGTAINIGRMDNIVALLKAIEV
jgi:methyl-accepting chemotaxis protein